MICLSGEVARCVFLETLLAQQSAAEDGSFWSVQREFIKEFDFTEGPVFYPV